MTVSAQADGIAGLVVDNYARDAEHIVASGFPVFCVDWPTPQLYAASIWPTLAILSWAKTMAW